MVSCSNGLVALVNVATFLLSLPILCVGIILATRGGATECEKFLQTPMIVLGVFIMIISLIGLHGACHLVIRVALVLSRDDVLPDRSLVLLHHIYLRCHECSSRRSVGHQ
ncbi:hypothetical protein Pint_14287 [Pistacia integerrima]|uniref:Uncharacterized protein n=1 Tax=Pistacia integerrima TaxID=434235 RepID=A0ACC0Y8J3_9ROSI|nr:hypothetical protein Pint_14287 [Pistacia integerrima]